MKKALKWIGIFLLGIFIIGIIGSLFDKKADAKPSNSDSTTTSAVNSDDTASDIKPATGWVYDSSVDKMTSKITYTAELVANDELQLKFPYDGGVTCMLYISKKDKKTSVLLSLSKGQLLAANDVDGGEIRVRFDDDKAENYSVSGSTDNSSNNVFINSADRFINKLKKSKKVIIQATVYDNGDQLMEFNTEGFELNK